MISRSVSFKNFDSIYIITNVMKSYFLTGMTIKRSTSPEPLQVLEDPDPLGETSLDPYICKNDVEVRR